MSRPIDETSVLKVLETLSPYVNNWVMEQVVSAIRALPTVKTEIIRCEDCIKHRESGLCERWSMYGTITTRDDDFCSWAERREE